jgi:hypothetical protein
MFARIGVMRALNRHHVPEFNPARYRVFRLPSSARQRESAGSGTLPALTDALRPYGCTGVLQAAQWKVGPCRLRTISKPSEMSLTLGVSSQSVSVRLTVPVLPHLGHRSLSVQSSSMFIKLSGSYLVRTRPLQKSK